MKNLKYKIVLIGLSLGLNTQPEPQNRQELRLQRQQKQARQRQEQRRHKQKTIRLLGLNCKSYEKQEPEQIKIIARQNRLKNFAVNLAKLHFPRTLMNLQKARKIIQMWTPEELLNFQEIRDIYEQFSKNWETIKNLDINALKKEIAPTTSLHYGLLRALVAFIKINPKNTAAHTLLQKLNLVEHKDSVFNFIKESSNYQWYLFELKKKIRQASNTLAITKDSEETNQMLDKIIQAVREVIETVDENILWKLIEYKKTIGGFRKAVIEIYQHEYAMKYIIDTKHEIESYKKIMKNCILLSHSTDLEALNKFIQLIDFIANKQKTKNTLKNAINTLEIVKEEKNCSSELIETLKVIKNTDISDDSDSATSTLNQLIRLFEVTL